jgi:PBP1b-binding outer membrane lipoprotein LpoB
MIRINIFICFFILISGCSNFDQEKSTVKMKEVEKNEFSFYDFNFSLKVFDDRVGLVEEIDFESIKPPESDHHNIRNIQYYNEELEKLSNPQIITNTVSSEKLNLIYLKLIEKLIPKPKVNTSIKKIPSPPKWDNEWRHCVIELDLKYRGDLYRMETQNYYKLYDNINAIIQPSR